MTHHILQLRKLKTNRAIYREIFLTIKNSLIVKVSINVPRERLFSSAIYTTSPSSDIFILLVAASIFLAIYQFMWVGLMTVLKT